MESYTNNYAFYILALQFSQALAHLDTAQQQIDGHLKSHGDMLKEVCICNFSFSFFQWVYFQMAIWPITKDTLSASQLALVP